MKTAELCDTQLGTTDPLPQRPALELRQRMYDCTELYKLNKDACLQQVIANAVAKVGAPALSDVYASKYGASAPVVLASAATR